MYVISDRFKNALRHSHTVVTRAVLVAANGATYELSLLDGSVTVDGTAAIRRRCSVTVIDDTGTIKPTNASSVLTPFGAELRLYRGIKFHDGTTEYVPLGVFVITSVKSIATKDGLAISIDGSDRSFRLKRSRFPRPYTIAEGLNYVDELRKAIASRSSSTQFRFTPASTTTPLVTLGATVDADPLDEYLSVATALGDELFYDPDGVLVLQPLRVSAPVVFVYDVGQTSILLSVDRLFISDYTYNHVIVTGEAGRTGSVFGEAQDTTAGSPTNVTGPYGDIVYFQSSAMISTNDQANAAAAGILARVLGRTEKVSFSALVNPAHEAGDGVTVQDPVTGASVSYVLDSFTIPLAPSGVLMATCRTRTT